jgi:hypothetical protein
LGTSPNFLITSVAEIARSRITRAAERNRTDVALFPRERFSPHHRGVGIEAFGRLASSHAVIAGVVEHSRCGGIIERCLVLAFTIVFVCPCASALAYCSVPSAPFCATRYGLFDDQDAFDRCKREMNSYKGEAESFLSCQKREADDYLPTLKRNSDDVIEEYSSAVETFNRRARG